MATFIQMVNRIASDLRRSNLTAQIKDAINDAVREAMDRDDPFWFLEAQSGLTTQFGSTELVGSDGYKEVLWVDILTPPRESLIELTLAEFEDHERYDNYFAYGRPQYWTMFGGKIKIWPPSDQAYSMLASTRFRTYPPFPFTTDNQTNIWLQDAELYIRWLAKRNVLRDVIRDYGEARIAEATAETHRQALIDRSHNLQIGNTLRSTKF